MHKQDLCDVHNKHLTKAYELCPEGPYRRPLGAGQSVHVILHTSLKNTFKTAASSLMTLKQTCSVGKVDATITYPVLQNAMYLYMTTEKFFRLVLQPE